MVIKQMFLILLINKGFFADSYVFLYITVEVKLTLREQRQS